MQTQSGCGMKSAGERKAAERARKRAEGLKFYEICLHPSEWPLVKRYIERLTKRRAK